MNAQLGDVYLSDGLPHLGATKLSYDGGRTSLVSADRLRLWVKTAERKDCRGPSARTERYGVRCPVSAVKSEDDLEPVTEKREGFCM